MIKNHDFAIVWHSNSDYFLCTSFRANIFNFHNSASSKENNLQNTVKNMYSFKLHKVSFKLHLIGQLKNASLREFKNYRSIQCQVTLGQQNFYSFRNIFVLCSAVFLRIKVGFIILSPNFGQNILFCLYNFHIWRSWHTFHIMLKSDDLEILIMWNSDTLAKLHNRHFADIKTENANMINQNLFSLLNKHHEKTSQEMRMLSNPCHPLIVSHLQYSI